LDGCFVQPKLRLLGLKAGLHPVGVSHHPVANTQVNPNPAGFIKPVNHVINSGNGITLPVLGAHSFTATMTPSIDPYEAKTILDVLSEFKVQADAGLSPAEISIR
jgi:hypothetical protein